MCSPPRDASPIWTTPTPKPAAQENLDLHPEWITEAEKIAVFVALRSLNFLLAQPTLEKMVANWHQAQVRYPQKAFWTFTELEKGTGLKLTQIEISSLLALAGATRHLYADGIATEEFNLALAQIQSYLP